MSRAKLVRIGTAGGLTTRSNMNPLKRLARLANCKEASRLISRAQDGRLPFGDWLRMRLHIHWCALCQRVERQVHVLREAMRRYRGE